MTDPHTATCTCTHRDRRPRQSINRQPQPLDCCRNTPGRRQRGTGPDTDGRTPASPSSSCSNNPKRQPQQAGMDPFLLQRALGGSGLLDPTAPSPAAAAAAAPAAADAFFDSAAEAAPASGYFPLPQPHRGLPFLLHGGVEEDVRFEVNPYARTCFSVWWGWALGPYCCSRHHHHSSPPPPPRHDTKTAAHDGRGLPGDRGDVGRRARALVHVLHPPPAPALLRCVGLV